MRFNLHGLNIERPSLFAAAPSRAKVPQRIKHLQRFFYQKISAGVISGVIPYFRNAALMQPFFPAVIAASSEPQLQ
jgi:hypothetical protein